MVSCRIVIFAVVSAISGCAGLVPETARTAIGIPGDAPNTEALMSANITGLEIPLTDSLRQVSVTIDADHGALIRDERFFVIFGDGSATSVRGLARKFGARGAVLQPVSTLNDPASQALPLPVLSSDFEEDSSWLDPVMLLKVSAAARSLSGGSQYEIPVMTMADAPLLVGGGVAALWTLALTAKVIKKRRRGGVVKVKRRRTRSQIV